MTRVTPADLAAQVRREWGVGDTQSLDVLGFLWSWEGISVIRTPFGEGSRASGMFVRKADSTLIVLNSSRTMGHQLFTAAHELYHVRFSTGMIGRMCMATQFPMKQPDELCADRFAAHLLVPKNGIDAMLAKHATDAEPSWPTVLRLEQHFRVSHKAMLWRLLDVGYFKDRVQMEQFSQGVTTQAKLLRYDTSLYTIHPVHQVLSDVPERIKTALDDQLISEGWANELLGAMGVNDSVGGGLDDGELD